MGKRHIPMLRSLKNTWRISKSMICVKIYAADIDQGAIDAASKVFRKGDEICFLPG